MGQDFQSKCLKKNQKVCDAYSRIILKELSDRGLDLPLNEEEVHMDENGDLIGSMASSVETTLFIDENGGKLEGLPLFLRSNGIVTDKRKSIERVEVVITTTFAYKIGDKETYAMKESDREKLRKILTDI